MLCTCTRMYLMIFITGSLTDHITDIICANDIFLDWSILSITVNDYRMFIENSFSRYYKSDNDVVEDVEIKAFADDMSTLFYNNTAGRNDVRFCIFISRFYLHYFLTSLTSTMVLNKLSPHLSIR